MTEELISVIDASVRSGKRKQTIFKVIDKLKITPLKQRHSEHKGQAIAYITGEEFDKIADYFLNKNKNDDETSLIKSFEPALTDRGFFYLIQLEPLDPGRFKCGFASIMNERLQKHRCSAPFLKIIGTWPCRRLWEHTAIDCVTQGCEKIHTEVFKTNSMEDVKNKCEHFFALMPKIVKTTL